MGSNSLGGKLGKWSSKCVFLGKACQVGKSADSWTIDLSFLAAVPEIELIIFFRHWNHMSAIEKRSYSQS